MNGFRFDDGSYSELRRGSYILYTLGDSVMLARVVLTQKLYCIVQPCPFLRTTDNHHHFSLDYGSYHRISATDILTGTLRPEVDGTVCRVDFDQWNAILDFKARS